MTFAVTEFKSEFRKGSKGIVLNKQYSYISLTLAATDVVLDFGTVGGALHTDLLTTAIGTKVSDFLIELADVAKAGPIIKSDELLTKLRVLSVTGNDEYKLEIVNNMPKITFNTADAPTSIVLEMEHLIDGSKTAKTVDYLSS